MTIRGSLIAVGLLLASTALATPSQVRTTVAGASPTSSEIPAFLAARVHELTALHLSSEVADQAALIPVLAADMKRKNDAKPVGQRQALDQAGWTAAAKSQIEGNKTTALTTSDDRYTAIRGGKKFDELHEFIHICSGPGGESPLLQFQLQLNEGAINYLSELAAPQAHVEVVHRYDVETRLVKRLAKLIGATGPEKVYAAALKGEVDGFFNAVGAAYVALGDKKPDGKAKGFSEKSWTKEAAAAEFRSKASNWNVKWLEERLPAI